MKAVRRFLLLLIVAVVLLGMSVTPTFAEWNVSLPGVNLTFWDSTDGVINYGETNSATPSDHQWTFTEMSQLTRKIQDTMVHVDTTANPTRSLNYLFLWTSIPDVEEGIVPGESWVWQHGVSDGSTTHDETSAQIILNDGLDLAIPPGGYDGVTKLNSDQPWYLGSDQVPQDRYDFLSVVNHEFQHYLFGIGHSSDPDSSLYWILGKGEMKQEPDWNLLGTPSGTGGGTGGSSDGGGGWGISPEPSSLLVLAGGLLSFVCIYRRRR